MSGETWRGMPSRAVPHSKVWCRPWKATTKRVIQRLPPSEASAQCMHVTSHHMVSYDGCSRICSGGTNTAAAAANHTSSSAGHRRRAEDAHLRRFLLSDGEQSTRLTNSRFKKVDTHHTYANVLDISQQAGRSTSDNTSRPGGGGWALPYRSPIELTPPT